MVEEVLHGEPLDTIGGCARRNIGYYRRFFMENHEMLEEVLHGEPLDGRGGSAWRTVGYYRGFCMENHEMQ